MILDDIVKRKRERLPGGKQRLPMDEMLRKLPGGKADSNIHSFKEALLTKGISIIAEIKKASPSKGLICENFEPVKIALQYEEFGASAISVLTEEDFFMGSNEYLAAVKNRVKIPVLRKDFIVDPWQIYESRLLGADAILLIAAILGEKELEAYRILAKELGMDALAEVHNEDELKKALNSGAEIIGINNRNLFTFEVDIKTTERLINKIPEGKAVVSESGINDHRDILYVKGLGAHAVLVGESLMRAPSLKNKLYELLGKA